MIKRRIEPVISPTSDSNEGLAVNAGVKDGTERATKVAADTARYEAVAREHGADLSEEGFNEALRKVVRTCPPRI